MATQLVNWSVREAAAADASRLSEFGARVYGATFAPDNDPAELALYLSRAYTPEAQVAELANPDICTLLVCAPGGVIAGFAQLRTGHAPSCVPDGSAIELWRFYIDHAWHGRGAAQALMDASLARGRNSGRADHIWLGVWERNARAQAFYRKYGFTPVGTHVFMFGNEPQTDEIWMRSLR